MNKPKKQVEIKLSAEDVEKAIEMYLNQDKIHSNISVINVAKTESRKWFLVATFE